MRDLERASREELIEIIGAQRAQIAESLQRMLELEARTEQLQEEVRRLRGGGSGTGHQLSLKPDRPPRKKKQRKRREQSYVRRRQAPDEIVHHALEQCPDCGRKLCGGWEHRRRQSIEIVLPRVRVVEHVMVARWCGMCEKRWLPKPEASEIGAVGKRRLGVSVQGLVATLHIACRLPMRMIRQLLRELWGLKISNGEVVALLDGVAEAGQPQLEGLHKDVRGSPAVCGDETGWREDGENGYLWTFSTPKVRWLEYRSTRSGQVPVEVLGEEFEGVCVSDFYAGYNRLEGRHQRCWVHLLRDLHELKEATPDSPQVSQWVDAIVALYREAKGFSHPRARKRQHQQRAFQQALARLAKPYAKDSTAPQRVLAQRMMRHLGELFVFVGDPEVPSDNNLAERSLRPAVIARKISGGTRSAKGSRTKMALMSLFGTWSVQDKPLLSTCTQLLSTPSR